MAQHPPDKMERRAQGPCSRLARPQEGPTGKGRAVSPTDLPAPIWVAIAVITVAQVFFLNWLMNRYPTRDCKSVGEFLRQCAAIALWQVASSVTASLVLTLAALPYILRP